MVSLAETYVCQTQGFSFTNPISQRLQGCLTPLWDMSYRLCRWLNLFFLQSEKVKQQGSRRLIWNRRPTKNHRMNGIWTTPQTVWTCSTRAFRLLIAKKKADLQVLRAASQNQEPQAVIGELDQERPRCWTTAGPGSRWERGSGRKRGTIFFFGILKSSKQWISWLQVYGKLRSSQFVPND